PFFTVASSTNLGNSTAGRRETAILRVPSSSSITALWSCGWSVSTACPTLEIASMKFHLFCMAYALLVRVQDEQGRVQGTFAESARDEEFEWLREAARCQLRLNIQEVGTARTGKDVIF